MTALLATALLLILVTRAGTAAGPHGGYTPATDECATCHRSHTAKGPQLIYSDLTGNAFCYSCHDGSGASVPPVASTHSNIDLSGVEEPFDTLCVQCHEPHGSTNLSNIRELVKVTTSPEVTSGPVVFTARTGAGSFDDGSGSTATRICTTCHDNVNNPGYPMVNHIGGANHSGGVNQEGTDCIQCHPHSPDEILENKDGFMPSGGSCTGCHASPQGSRRQITGPAGDFTRTSHHISSGPTDADCEVCHDQSQHQGGTVRLFNVDNTSTVYTFTGPADGGNLEPFCLACHDSDGAGGSPPFSDSAVPPVIDQPAWGGSTHKTQGSTCYSCHDNGHGSNKQRLLAPWDWVSDSDPDDPMKQEERFCYDCHPGEQAILGRPARWVPAEAGPNLLLNLNDRHDVAATDQIGNNGGSKIECINCHNPHVASPGDVLVADPDPGDGRTPGSGYATGSDPMSDWCLDCHDGSYPSGVQQGTVNLGNILTFSATDSHGAAGGSATLKAGYGYVGDMFVQCMQCHIRHGSPTNQNLFHVLDTVMSTDGTTPVPADMDPYNLTDNSVKNPNVNGYYWCNTCHTGSMGDKKDNCFDCHRHSDRW